MKNKNLLIKKYFDKKEQLTLKDQTYQKIVKDLITWLLKNDKVTQDITGKLLFEKEKIVRAQIIAKQNLTLAGIEEIKYLLQNFTKIKYKILFKEGNQVKDRQSIVKLEGDIREILSYERVILNILQRLSGIATDTRNIINKIQNSKLHIAATRKTPWGLLDKKAVAVGGGLTHRLNLADNVLIKDNHLMHISPTEALNKILNQTDNTLIEIEVEDEKNLLELVNSFSKSQTANTLAILLDNFSPPDAKEILLKYNLHANIIFEASGNITAENISEWANTGVDIISLGSLTHSPKAVDISLDLL